MAVCRICPTDTEDARAMEDAMLTADTITDEQIKALRDRACECRDERGNKPPIESPDEHAACHDCDIEVYDMCVVALEAIDEEAMTARARCAEILNARRGVKP